MKGAAIVALALVGGGLLIFAAFLAAKEGRLPARKPVVLSISGPRRWR